MAEKVKAKSGDTLSGIAKAQGTTVAQILADNPTLAARQAAGQTVLFSGTTVKITAPQQATNPYAAATSGPAAGAGTNVGTASVPFNAAADALRKLTGGQTLTDAEKTILGMGNTGAVSSDTTGITDGSGDTPPAGVTEVSRVDNKDGTFTVTYSDGSVKVIGTKTATGKKIVRQYYSGSGAARVQITEYSINLFKLLSLIKMQNSKRCLLHNRSNLRPPKQSRLQPSVSQHSMLLKNALPRWVSKRLVTTLQQSLLAKA